MNGKYLLDTNIVIELWRRNASVAERLRGAEEVFISTIVLGELYYGAFRSSRVEHNLTLIEEFASNNTVLYCDSETARRYGEIKNGLRVKGQPIPENDIWIAALAIQHDLTLSTRDAHLEQVDNLKIEAW